MEQYINKDALVARIKRRINEINLDTIEDWRYRLQREHDIEVMKNILSLINSLEVKEVDLEEIIKFHFDIKNINNVKITTTGKDILNLAMRINKFAMNTAFEQYSQIGESTGNESLNEEIEKTIKMNDMWCGLMPNTLIKYTAKHFFELGLKAQKGEKV